MKKSEQFVIDMRSKEEKEMIRLNEPAHTYKLTPEIYEERAQLNNQNVSHFVINPSLYNLAPVEPSQNV